MGLLGFLKPKRKTGKNTDDGGNTEWDSSDSQDNDAFDAGDSGED
jgi:hypothetical protein